MRATIGATRRCCRGGTRSCGCCTSCCASRCGRTGYVRRMTDITCVGHAGIPFAERPLGVSCCILSATQTVVHLMITVVVMTTGTERAVVVVMMESVAVMPVPIMLPAIMCVPPCRIISPVPRRCPCYPCRAPEPIVDYRTVNIYRLYDVVLAINVLVTYYLNGYNLVLIFLNVDRRYILEYILRQYGLQYDQTLVPFACLYYSQIVHFPVSVEIKVTERAIRVVEQHLELFQVFSFCKQFSYNLQIESFRDVRTVGRYRDRFICP